MNQYKRTNSPDPCCCLVLDREDSDPRNIANAEIVSLRGFTTKVRAALLSKRLDSKGNSCSWARVGEGCIAVGRMDGWMDGWKGGA